MGVLDERRRLRTLAAQLQAGKPLTADQSRWLSDALSRIGGGVDANAVFGVKRTRGTSIQDEIARRRLNFTLFYIAGALSAGVDRQSAFEEGVRLLRWLHGLSPEDDSRYDVDTLERAWNKNKDWQRPERLEGEPDSFL